MMPGRAFDARAGLDGRIYPHGAPKLRMAPR